MNDTRSTSSDEALLRAYVRGDRDPFGRLATRHERGLLGLARACLGGRSDLAEDAVQEVWARVLRSAARFKYKSTVKTWLYRITVNVCHDMQTRARRDSRAREHAHGIALANINVFAQTERDEDMRALQRAVDELPWEQRSILLLCHHRGFTMAEAAEVLGAPIGTIKSRLHAAKHDLRRALNTGAKQ